MAELDDERFWENDEDADRFWEVDEDDLVSGGDLMVCPFCGSPATVMLDDGTIMCGECDTLRVVDDERLNLYKAYQEIER